MRKQNNLHLANSGAKLGNWNAGGQKQMNLVLPAQGYIPEPPPSPVNTLSILHVIKSHETETINIVPINLHATVSLPLSASIFL